MFLRSLLGHLAVVYDRILSVELTLTHPKGFSREFSREFFWEHFEFSGQKLRFSQGSKLYQAFKSRG